MILRNTYEEELLDKVILPNLQHCSTEADPFIRCASSKLLIEIALNCYSKRFSDLFDILEKVLKFFFCSKCLINAVLTFFKFFPVAKSSFWIIHYGTYYFTHWHRYKWYYCCCCRNCTNLPSQTTPFTFFTCSQSIFSNFESLTTSLWEAFLFWKTSFC